MGVKMDKMLNAVKEASISIACLLDEPTEVTVKDLEHLQNQITILENELKENENE
tara:strand:+ start:318 stop:482 length:165 start_codon:yes stop_codon:yes gene_type:complete